MQFPESVTRSFRYMQLPRNFTWAFHYIPFPWGEICLLFWLHAVSSMLALHALSLQTVTIVALFTQLQPPQVNYLAIEVSISWIKIKCVGFISFQVLSTLFTFFSNKPDSKQLKKRDDKHTVSNKPSPLRRFTRRRSEPYDVPAT